MRRAALLALVSVSGCYTLGPPTSGYEIDEYACADERDNDQDGRIDCMDNDCIMRGHCGEQIPIIPPVGLETTFENCRDGIDNDDDGAFDCGDRGCQEIMELCCVSEVDDASCSDLVDNDGNGFTDCGDFSCRNNDYVTVCASECGACGCLEDPTSLARCSDGLDGDGDRDSDCNDTDCACTSVCNPDCAGPENTEARCSDGISNDGDPYVDCDDRDCDPLCCTGTGTPENSVASCSDGVDNDCNSYLDCEDRSCFDSTLSPPGGAAVEYCQARAETTLATCSDGIDNDDNDFIDCNDFSCSRSTNSEVLAHCRDVTEASLENCTDNVDNDNNGHIDCGDFSCDFVIAGWGVNLCATAEDCGPGFVCEENTCIFSCGAGETCPPGTQCDPINDICIQPCTSSAECDAGESCYRMRCLTLRSPCLETATLDPSTTIQSHLRATPEDDATWDERNAMTLGACSDGLDNDGDSFIDCEDWECNYNPLARVGVGCELANSCPPMRPEGCRQLCQSAIGGRTCIFGSFAGQPCDTDAECGGVSGACVLSGPPDITLVCP